MDINLISFDISDATREPLDMSSPTLPPECLPSVYLGPYSGAESVAIGFSMALWGESAYSAGSLTVPYPSLTSTVGATCMQMYVPNGLYKYISY